MMYSQTATISSDELKRRMANHEDLIILDVRQPDERADFHILGDTLFIPLGELPARIDELDPYRNREIIIYCRSGNRSGQACQYLGQRGFKTINLAGGTLKWRS